MTPSKTEGSLTEFTLSAWNRFEMTGIVIPNGREESFPHVFFLGDRQIMNKVVMKNRYNTRG